MKEDVKYVTSSLIGWDFDYKTDLDGERMHLKGECGRLSQLVRTANFGSLLSKKKHYGSFTEIISFTAGSNLGRYCTYIGISRY